MKYEHSSPPGSQVKAKVKVFHKNVKLQGQGGKVTNNGTDEKALPQGMYI